MHLPFLKSPLTIDLIDGRMRFMVVLKKDISPSVSKILYAVKPVSIIYLLWCVASLVFFHLGFLIAGSETTAQFLLPVSVIIFILLAAFLTMLFMVYVEKHIQDDLFVRVFWLAFTFLIWGIGYLFVTATGDKINSFYSFSTANLIFFSCVLGNWMTTPLKRAAEIIPLCVIVAFSDLFSVFSGPTKHLAENISVYYESGMQGPPPFIDYFLVKIALPGIEPLMPVFGVSDWIIVAFLSAAACKFHMNDNIAGKGICRVKRKPNFLFFPVASAGLIISIITAQTSTFFLPALPFIVVVFLSFMIIKYPEIRKLTKAEVIPMALFSGVIAMLMVLV